MEWTLSGDLSYVVAPGDRTRDLLSPWKSDYGSEGWGSSPSGRAAVLCFSDWKRARLRSCLQSCHYPESLTFYRDETTSKGLAPLHEHSISAVVRVAKLHHILEQIDSKLAYDADAFGIAAGEPTR
jgi:hypothetical protein